MQQMQQPKHMQQVHTCPASGMCAHHCVSNSGEASAVALWQKADLAPPLRLELVRLIPVGCHVLHSVHGDPQQHPPRHKQLPPSNPHVPLQIPPGGSGAHDREQAHALLQTVGWVVCIHSERSGDEPCADAHATLNGRRCAMG